MSLSEEHEELLKSIKEVVESVQIEMRKYLMGMTKEERFRFLREDISLRGIETLCGWALPEEDYEICASVEEVKANNIATFKVSFCFLGEDTHKAIIVKFDADGKTYYHADYLLDGNEGAVVMLHKDDEGLWTSEWESNDPNLISPIGQAIDVIEGR